jgi:nitrile hydratase
MNGIHDMGGMQGMGPVQHEQNEPVFHSPWEGRIYAINRALGAWRKWNIDAGRHQIELIPPADYLRMSYYEKWLTRNIELLVKHGLVTREERFRAPGTAKTVPALTADQVAPTLARGRSFERPLNRPPRFGVGQRVRARKINPTGHTRLPRYARGNVGVVDRLHGGHVFPDSNAMGKGEDLQHLYSVRFSARELWGEAAGARDAVYLDLWEDYLDPV